MVQNLPFFVYGTLRRGECRQRCWPHTPQRVLAATTRGRLLHLGDYPGLIAGDHEIVGELWYFTPTEIESTMAVLDEVEGYNQPLSPNLYVRDVIDCLTLDHVDVQAYAYRYARYDPRSSWVEIEPDQQGRCDWRREPRGSNRG